MNSLELLRVLETDPIVRRTHVGVYSRNTLPKKTLTPGCRRVFVVNTDVVGGKGEHWCCIFIEPNGTGQFFDSFGTPPLHKEFITFLKKNTTKYTFNSTMIQGFQSQACGLYVAYYIICKCRGQTLRRLMRVFSVYSLYKNDTIVTRMLQKLRGYKNPCTM